MNTDFSLKAFDFNKEVYLYNWIEIIDINGISYLGKNILLEHIVSKIDRSDLEVRPTTYIFNSHVGGVFPHKAKEMENSIYLLLRELKSCVQCCSRILVVVEELDRFFDFALNPGLLRSAFLELLMNLNKWKITLITTRQSLLEEWNKYKPIAHDGLRLQIVLGDRALKIANQIWGSTDNRYLWLVEQKRPCIVCNNNSVEVAIVPEIQLSKPNNSEENAN
jgi:hypothetical protein